MRARFIGIWFLLACLVISAGCAKPWYGFDWLDTSPRVDEDDDESDGDQMSKMRSREDEIWPTGASSRSREIESRLGVGS